MRRVIRECYPSYRSRIERRIVHKDREAERMVKRGHLLSRVVKKTGRDIDWLQLVKELYDDAEQRDILIGLEETLDTKVDEAMLRCGINSLLDKSDNQAYYAGKAAGLNNAWKEIDKILNPEMYYDKKMKKKMKKLGSNREPRS